MFDRGVLQCRLRSCRRSCNQSDADIVNSVLQLRKGFLSEMMLPAPRYRVVCSVSCNSGMLQCSISVSNSEVSFLSRDSLPFMDSISIRSTSLLRLDLFSLLPPRLFLRPMVQMYRRLTGLVGPSRDLIHVGTLFSLETGSDIMLSSKELPVANVRRDLNTRDKSSTKAE